jgi:hypothetical protein
MSEKENKELVEKYPWLMPKSALGYDDIDYDYSWTLLDQIPRGWRKAFGELICADIQRELEAANLVDTYGISEIKEKFGELRWYDYGGNEKIDDIVMAYTVISRNVCVQCGKLDVHIFDNGWIQPLCKECANKYYKNLVYEDWIVEGNDGVICEEDRFSRYDYATGKWTEHTVDISDYVRKVREYNKCT